MRIAILSDIHDNVWKLAAALERMQRADAMVCCGDLCSPFVVAQLAEGFAGPIHVVFGNNDGDLFRITQTASGYDHVHIHGELFQGELGGRRVAANHFDHIARRLAAGGEFDVVCYGHNHVFKVERLGRTLSINPGTIMGYDAGQRKDVASTFVTYDTESDEVARHEV